MEEKNINVEEELLDNNQSELNLNNSDIENDLTAEEKNQIFMDFFKNNNINSKRILKDYIANNKFNNDSNIKENDSNNNIKNDNKKSKRKIRKFNSEEERIEGYRETSRKSSLKYAHSKKGKKKIKEYKKIYKKERLKDYLKVRKYSSLNFYKEDATRITDFAKKHGLKISELIRKAIKEELLVESGKYKKEEKTNFMNEPESKTPKKSIIETKKDENKEIVKGEVVEGEVENNQLDNSQLENDKLEGDVYYFEAVCDLTKDFMILGLNDNERFDIFLDKYNRDYHEAFKHLIFDDVEEEDVDIFDLSYYNKMFAIIGSSIQEMGMEVYKPIADRNSYLMEEDFIELNYNIKQWLFEHGKIRPKKTNKITSDDYDVNKEYIGDLDFGSIKKK